MADISRARAELGYEPEIDLAEGVRRTVASYVASDEASEHPRVMRSIHRAPARAAKPKPNAPVARRRGRHYLVTGGAGFIGSHLIESLVEHEKADRVVILDDLSTGQLENVEHLLSADRVSFVHGSVNDSELVDDLMREADTCVHLASAVGVQMIVNEPLDTLMRSVRGSNVVMHAASRHDVRVLFSSTSEVYGKQSHTSLTEQDDLVFGSPSKGRWTYAIAKSFGEALIHGYHLQRGADARIVRLFNTVGPRQTGAYGMVLPRFVRQALAGEDLTVYGSGTQNRCFTHVRDTVAGLVALCECDAASGKTFNIGSSTPTSIVELARRVIERAESESKILLVPYEEAYGSGFEELGSRRPDTTALRNLTGWQTHATIEDAIDDVIAYERSQLETGTRSEKIADVA
jgi:UDP-glucose 4-epimerase